MRCRWRRLGIQDGDEVRWQWARRQIYTEVCAIGLDDLIGLTCACFGIPDWAVDGPQRSQTRCRSPNSPSMSSSVTLSGKATYDVSSIQTTVGRASSSSPPRPRT